MNTSKVHLRVEQFSLKMNWKLAERLPYKKDYKIHMESGRKGKDMIRSGPVPLKGDTEEKRDYIGGDPPWGVSSSSHRLGISLLGSNTGETGPWLAGGLLGLTGGVWEAWTPFVRRVHAGLPMRQ